MKRAKENESPKNTKNDDFNIPRQNRNPDKTSTRNPKAKDQQEQFAAKRQKRDHESYDADQEELIKENKNTNDPWAQ